MAFDKLESLTTSGVRGMPASVSLSASKSARPRCLVSFSAAFTSKAAIDLKHSYDVLVGGGEQKGLLRLKQNAKGIAKPRAMRNGAVTFNLGFIEKFGTEAEPKQFCNADVIEPGVIEVVLPPWADEIEG